MKKLEKSHYLGCIVGGAIGDALGAPIEFLTLESILKDYGCNGVNDFVEFENGKGEITDDTQMLLFTAEGLLRSSHRSSIRGIGGAYLQICYHSYLRWWSTQKDWYAEESKPYMDIEGWLLKESFLHQRRAPGNTCLTSLRKGIMGTMQNPINDSKGCGGIMRIAPVGLRFYDNELAFKLGAELAAMTHGHPSGYLSAGFLSCLISILNHGYNLKEAINTSIPILKTYLGHAETLTAIQKALKLHETKNPTYQKVESLGEGWVGEEALAISLYCALSYENDFEKSINLAINHSGDSDSTGSITGNIVGMILGEQSIPERWINNLSNYEVIKQIGIDLHTVSTGNSYDYIDYSWELKYPPY